MTDPGSESKTVEQRFPEIVTTDSSRPSRKRPPANPLTWFFVATSAIWGVIAIFLAREDQSWGAMYLTVFAGPAVNAGIAFAGVLAVMFVHFANRQVAWRQPVLFIIIAAVVSSVAIFCSLFTMQLHGC